MKIFESARANYAFMGISSMQSIQPNRFNTKITVSFIAIGAATTFHLMHIIVVASNLREYMESATTTSGSVIISISYTTVVFKMRTVFESMNGFEEMIVTSELSVKSSAFHLCSTFLVIFDFFKGLKYPASKAIFEKTNRFIEKLSKILLFLIMGVGLNCVILLQCIARFYIYFTTDLGGEAFVLPIPMW